MEVTSVFARLSVYSCVEHFSGLAFLARTRWAHETETGVYFWEVVVRCWLAGPCGHTAFFQCSGLRLSSQGRQSGHRVLRVCTTGPLPTGRVPLHVAPV
eukprot:scaffold18694_cov99-Isochrysis_galbana.AAC.1